MPHSIEGAGLKESAFLQLNPNRVWRHQTGGANALTA
jgi:hypothetical protein